MTGAPTCKTRFHFARKRSRTTIGNLTSERPDMRYLHSMIRVADLDAAIYFFIH
jgi:hypothetical protein